MDWTPGIMERDYPNLEYKDCTCFYCGEKFDDNSVHFSRVWEHLNDNESDNRPENMVWAHAVCNEEKKNNYDWKILAAEKLRENQKWAQRNEPAIKGEMEGARTFSQHKPTSDEADVAAVLYKHAVQLLTQELLPQGGNPPKRDSIPLKEAAECVDYLTKVETGGRGSQSAAQRHLETLSCAISKDFERRSINGKQIIFRRTGQ